MKKVTLFIFFLFSCLMLSAQSGYIKVSGGKVIEGDFFKSKIYLLKNFTDAKIKFLNGDTYDAKINIHILSQTLRFIGPQGDTLAVADEKHIGSVSSGKLFFLKVNNQYVQVVNSDGETSLVVARALNIGQEKVTGAYGGTNEVSSIQKIEVYNDNNKIERITSSATLFYEYRETLFLVNRGKLYLVTRRNLQKFFPDKKEFIEEYYSTHNIQIDKKEEIVSLFNTILSFSR